MVDDPQGWWPSHEAYVKSVEKMMEIESHDFDTKPVTIRRGDRRYSLLRWIPVSERLPEKGSRVFVGAWIDGRWTTDAGRWLGYWSLSGFVDPGVFTHWMTSPEPPTDVA